MSPIVSYKIDSHHERLNLTPRRHTIVGTPTSNHRADEMAIAPNGRAPSRPFWQDLRQSKTEVRILLPSSAAYNVSFGVPKLLTADITDRGIRTVRQRSCRNSEEDEKLLP